MKPASTQEETAWQLFVAAHCTVNTPAGQKLNWETWTEQTCWLNPSAPGCKSGEEKKRFSHAISLLATRGKLATPAATGGLPGCQTMTTKSSQTPKSLLPFVPGNLSANPQFCEEVYVNAAEAAFVTAPPGGKPGATLTTRVGQADYIATTGKPLDFPKEAVEIKADWIAASSLNAASFFNCSDKKPAGVYVQTIDGVCYALVGVHISSKLYPNWLWATFEPQSPLTNPNRCKPSLYSSCNDPWGSNPALSTGQATAATKNLTNLMDQAGLAPEFRNYRLVGTQTQYEQPLSSKGKLGNSFVEFNARVLPQQASCITCHGYAAINVALHPPGTGNGGPIGNGPSIGKPVIPPTIPGRHWEPVDFSWMLGFMPGK
ncbi:hypothetical protein ACS5PK_08390 [Roseateles sp. DB2]|uniref:hypothetical protein n=1 Tax=Roseateles sp. DB2 TaxID=3453717 RepID=UPI003EEBFEC4